MFLENDVQLPCGVCHGSHAIKSTVKNKNKSLLQIGLRQENTEIAAFAMLALNWKSLFNLIIYQRLLILIRCVLLCLQIDIPALKLISLMDILLINMSQDGKNHSCTICDNDIFFNAVVYYIFT